MHTSLSTPAADAPQPKCPARDESTSFWATSSAISGSYHAIRQAKYARRYLAEAAYRFNRRLTGHPSVESRLREMLPRLATAMMRCKPCPEPLLRAASHFHG